MPWFTSIQSFDLGTTWWTLVESNYLPPPHFRQRIYSPPWGKGSKFEFVEDAHWLFGGSAQKYVRDWASSTNWTLLQADASIDHYPSGVNLESEENPIFCKFLMNSRGNTIIAFLCFQYSIFSAKLENFLNLCTLFPYYPSSWTVGTVTTRLPET